MANDPRTWIGGKAAATTDFNQADNYAEAAVPVNDDELYYPSTNLYGVKVSLAQSAIDLNKLTVEQGSPVEIGSLSTSGIPTYLELGLNGGTGDNLFDYAGTGACYFDIDDATEIRIRSAGPGSAYGYGLVMVGTDNDAVNIVKSNIGSGANKIGFAPFGGSVFETDAMNISAYDVYMGAGCVKKDGSSAIPITMSGGNVYTECALGASTVTGGVLNVRRGAVASLTASGAKINYEGTGTITTLILGGDGVFDARVGSGSAVITNIIQMSAGSHFYDPEGRFGNVTIKFNGCRRGDVTIDTPMDKTIEFS